MKARRSLLLFLMLVLVFVGACSVWLWKANRQYALNRQLIAALKNNDTKQALVLVNAGADPNTRYNPPPVPTLQLLLNQLLRRSPVPADDSPTAFLMVCGTEWYEPNIVHAIGCKCPEDVTLVRLMLAHRAQCNTVDVYNRSSLYYAVMRNYPHVVQLLLEHGANVNAQDDYGMTPLMWAVLKADTSMTCLLLEHGANVSVEDSWGSTALYKAVLYNRSSSAIALLMAHGADPNRADEYGNTPLTIAQQHQRPNVVALLRGNVRFYPHPASGHLLPAREKAKLFNARLNKR